MAQCPVCEAPIHADFGLIECESCGVQLLVHVDGRVEHQGAEGKQVLGADLVPEEPPSLGKFSTDAEPDGAVAPEAPFDFAEPEREIDFENLEQPEVPSDDPAGYEATQMIASESEAAAADFSNDEGAPVPEYNFDEPSGDVEPAPPAYESAPAPDSPDLSDVARFGNSDVSGGSEGALRYTLFIEGIDTADVRMAFREAITDRKFVWDIDTILRSVRNGEVTIQNVAPTKAYILISRLRNLPVKVRWEQYALSQT